ncbi:hypothetical protein PFISCL1PPCAC_10762 [Pristionchus fissidentatus]|uniref:RanBD1 domain-containing protein n=1 Tax=Pristionchus fissidentatus TaxID=1538716 RepID=A0AAV5VLD5_9BILA|nr:hypothetical protein PFISCL1PPCAC_10762 [Pristionchus fissidentatus]
MARDESSVTTLSFEKRTQLLNAKLAILNRDFVRFLCDEVGKDAEIDLTPTVNSYVENVNDLRRMYDLGTGKEGGEKRDGDIVRKKVTARRRLKGEGETTRVGDLTTPSVPHTPQLKMSTPAGSSAPTKLDMTVDISAISPFGGFAAAAAAKIIDKDDTLKALPPTIGAPSAGAGGRKRAIRGGGPLGDGESVVFRGNSEGDSTSVATPTITVKPPPIDFQLPKGNAGFWGAKPKEADKKEEKKEEKKVEEKKEESKPFTFGGSVPKFTGFNFGGVASSSSTPADSTPKLPSGGGFNLFGSTTAPPSSSSTPVLSFGSKPTGGMPLAFPSLAPATTAAAATATGAATTQGADGDEEGEYVPPKVEVVENKEDDAKISVKCAVFKLEGKEYAKLGVGQLYVKENEGKSSLLVRAATATGTIWVNNRVDSTMKTEMAADDKIRVSVPVSASEIKTFVIRIGTKEDAAKILKMLKDGGAK